MSTPGFVEPDIEAMTAALDAEAQKLDDQGGSLAWGIFRRGGPARAVNADVPYRIASMTKSFTSAAIGILAADGLDLDVPFGQLLPELVDTAIGDRTCRQALTMSTGFTKDDPWADRMEAMTPAELTDWLHRGAIACAPADTGYEYSNLGYALLGMVAETVTGRPFTEFVSSEIFGPLRLMRTGFDHTDFPDLATGYRVDLDGGLHPAELTGPGVFSPIGGVISTVNDIRTWMDTHLDALERMDTFAAGSRSRILTDSQQPRRTMEIQTSEHHAETLSYGYGLETRLDTRFGRVVCHSGGYPGYGSHMRWFPDLGLSIVVLGNTTYFPAQRVVQDALDRGWAAATGQQGTRLERRATSAPVPRYPASQAQIDTVIAAANLVNEFDDTVAEAIFSMNMDLDEPRDERRERFTRWRAEKQLDRPLTEADLTMVSPLRGIVTVPGKAEAKATITVGLNHLGEVQAITLSS
ncbi:CubicO group peptidase, beta-lactamase class C family [Brevibacterium siliguriense]|uniref:CubicO group peptidase, beta-lactamase class C family n=1 Tax=Brevibacterium siliguriense TaxID=1136497 RepID=A0A1H1S852_9MICO|nr:serine hydrolase domain-containing protein [Brevibacterium siliguriense]SDS43926.1 CubicO group peptidase, beta-lactamase class C family [Brevibacterium siliguriense]